MALELAAQRPMPIEVPDIGVAITKITHEMPSQSDIDRVKARLETSGWPICDSVDPPPDNR